MSALKQFRFARDEEERPSTPKKEKLSLSDTGAEDAGCHEPCASDYVDNLLTRTHTESSSSCAQPATFPSCASKLENEAPETDTGDQFRMEPTPRPPEETTDPVRIYLREIRRVPLLDREKEVKIAKRIERAPAARLAGTFTVACRNPPNLNPGLRFGVRSSIN